MIRKRRKYIKLPKAESDNMILTHTITNNNINNEDNSSIKTIGQLKNMFVHVNHLITQLITVLYFHSQVIYHTHQYIYLYISTSNIIHKLINYIVTYH